MGNVNEREGVSVDTPPSPCPIHDDGEGPSSPVLVVIEEARYHSMSVRRSPRIVTEDESNSPETFEPKEDEQMSLMERQGHYADHSVDAVDVFGDDSLPLSDSVIPASFEFVNGHSPVLSGGSDVFHTPEVSHLDIQGSQISAEAPGPPSTLESGVNTLKATGTLKCSSQRQTCSTYSELHSKEAEADTTDSDFFEYVSRDVHLEGQCSESQAHPPVCLSFLDDLKNPECASKATLAPCSLETTFFIEELKAKSEGAILKLEAPAVSPTLKASEDQAEIREEFRHIVSEPTAPPKLNDLVEVVSQPTKPGTKAVPDKVVRRNLESQTGLPSSGPRHTPEKPNWALAPEDPPKHRTTSRRNAERAHTRRSKQPDGDSSPEAIPQQSSKVSNSSRRRSKPMSPPIALVPPVQSATGLNAAKHSLTLVNHCENSSRGEDLRCLPLIPATESKLSPSGKQVFKEGSPAFEMDRLTLRTNSSDGHQVGKRTLLEPVRESRFLIQGFPTSMDVNKRSRLSFVSVDNGQKSDRQTSRRSPPQRSKLALLTIVESASNTVNDEFGKSSTTPYQPSPLDVPTSFDEIAIEEKKGPPAQVTTGINRVVADAAKSHSSDERKTLEGSRQDNWDRFQPDSTPVRRVRKAERLSWPSSEEDHKDSRTAQDREPLPWRNKMNNQAFSRHHIPPIPSAPPPVPKPNQSAAATSVEISSSITSKEILHPGTQNNYFHPEGCARVNLPSKSMHLQLGLQGPAVSLGIDTTRPPLSSNIPMPIRTQNRSESTEDDPNRQVRVGAMALTNVGLETVERTFIPRGPLLTRLPELPRPGHVYRTASLTSTSIRQPEFQVGNSVPEPIPKTRQEFHGLQYSSLAGHQSTSAIILPMTNDTSRPSVPPIPMSRPDYPFANLAYVHNYQVNRAYPQDPTPLYTGTSQPPTTRPTSRLHRSTSVYGGWRERHGLGLSREMAKTSYAQLNSESATSPAVILASRGFPNTPVQRDGNAAHFIRET